MFLRKILSAKMMHISSQFLVLSFNHNKGLSANILNHSLVDDINTVMVFGVAHLYTHEHVRSGLSL